MTTLWLWGLWVEATGEDDIEAEGVETSEFIERCGVMRFMVERIYRAEGYTHGVKLRQVDIAVI